MNRDVHKILFPFDVIKAVACGSKYRSPFFHLSRTLAGAHKFAKLGQKTRKEKNTEQIMTRVSLLEMYKDGGLLPGNLIDLSSRESASSLLAPLYAIHGQLE